MRQASSSWALIISRAIPSTFTLKTRISIAAHGLRSRIKVRGSWSRYGGRPSRRDMVRGQIVLRQIARQLLRAGKPGETKYFAVGKHATDRGTVVGINNVSIFRRILFWRTVCDGGLRIQQSHRWSGRPPGLYERGAHRERPETHIVLLRRDGPHIWSSSEAARRGYPCCSEQTVSLSGVCGC